MLYGGPNGTLQHLSVELFARTADIRVQLVPYRGSPQAVADLLGKRLDFMLDPPTAHLEAIKSGQLRALATTGATRSSRCRRCRPSPSRASRTSSSAPGRA